jgi:hypothetical protein
VSAALFVALENRAADRGGRYLPRRRVCSDSTWDSLTRRRTAGARTPLEIASTQRRIARARTWRRTAGTRPRLPIAARRGVGLVREGPHVANAGSPARIDAVGELRSVEVRTARVASMRRVSRVARCGAWSHFAVSGALARSAVGSPAARGSTDGELRRARSGAGRRFELFNFVLDTFLRRAPPRPSVAQVARPCSRVDRAARASRDAVDSNFVRAFDRSRAREYGPGETEV